MNAPLELDGLTKVFPTPTGPFIAVKDVNASVKTGEFVAILGHSGCGKSTVLSILAGLDQATFGGVVIDGKQVDAPGPERAIVFQSPSLLPWLTSEQNVRAVATSMGLPPDPAVEPQWRTRGYLTVIRRNWHLLPYDQVLTLLDMPAERLAYVLREDDFLFVKLGNHKPKCPPLGFAAPDAKTTERAARIKRVLAEHFGAELNRPAEPRFEFLKRFNQPVTNPRPAPRAARPAGPRGREGRNGGQIGA